MRKKFFTVLILRHAGMNFRKLHLSYGFVISTAAVAVVLVAAGLAAPHLFFKVRSQSVTLDRLSHENSKLATERSYYEGALTQLADRLGAFEERTSLIAQELGVEEAAAEAPGGGGFEGERGPRRFRFDDDLRILQSRTERLDRSIEELDETFQERTRQLAATPSIIPVHGWFSHGYGWRTDPFTNEREFHRGIDIVTEEGTEIVAPADGVVARSGRFSDYGNSIDISHGYGYVTRYAHMSEVLVRSGDRVRRGDPIGKVGSTGRSTGPHLHYEVFRDGRRVNPWKYLGQK